MLTQQLSKQVASAKAPESGKAELYSPSRADMDEAPQTPTASRLASSASQDDVGGDSASSVPGVTAQQTAHMACAVALGEDASSVNLIQSAFPTVSKASEMLEHELSPSLVLPPGSQGFSPHLCYCKAHIHGALCTDSRSLYCRDPLWRRALVPRASLLILVLWTTWSSACLMLRSTSKHTGC